MPTRKPRKKSKRKKRYERRADYPAQKEAYARYRKTQCRTYTFTVQHDKDEDIIDFLDGIDKKVDYFRELVRADIAATVAYETRTHI